MTTTSFTVSSEGSTTSTDLTTLNGVIRSIDFGGTNAGAANYTITLSQGFTLTAGDLLAFNVPGSTVTINGGNFAINGNGDQRGLFVYSGTVDVNNLTLTNMQALGGNGGGAHGGAGGGAGLGGGLFIASAGAAVLDNVTFTSDRATGGAGGGGSIYPTDYAIGDGLAGGGGMGGNGAARGSSGGQLSHTAGGGGGLGLGANGGSGKSSAGLPGLPGIVPGATAGGSGYDAALGAGGVGGAGGGGGGGGGASFGLAGGGGIDGHTATAGGAPNNGGFGGGGGAGHGGTGAPGSAGNGGFGGGGGFGSNGDGGSGGFGGGGGDANLSTHGIHVGDGGFGGGNAGNTGYTTGFNWGGGGGGLGAGGDIFVQQNGSLTIEGGSLATGTVNVGAGGTGGPTGTNGGAGGNYGQDIFIEGTQSITFGPPTATTMALSGTIADQSGNGGGAKNPGVGSLILNGLGKLQLAVANTYTGTTTLDEGTLELQNASAAGSGKIVFAADSTATLEIDDGDTPLNTIKGFVVDAGTIDLGGIGTATRATISSHTLTVDYGSNSSLTLSLDTSEDYTGDLVKIASDNAGGTDLEMETYSPPVVTAGGSVDYEEGQSAAVTLDSTLTVVASFSPTLSSATVTITNAQTGDTLDFTTQNGISETSFSNGILTLSGSASVADYQTALESVTFSSTSTTNGDRTIDWVVSDGTGSSTAAMSTVDVTLGPSVVAGASINYEEGQSVTPALDSALTVSDPSNANLSSATVTITNAQTGDTLNFTNQNGISGSFSGGVLSLAGSSTLAHYQTALESVTFSTTSTTSGDRTIDWQVGDGVVNSSVATSTVDVTAGPSVVAGASINYEIAQTAPALDSSLTVGDPSNANLSSATVTITNAQTGDTLNFTNQNGISGSFSGGVLSLAGSSTLAHYQTALESITFSSTSSTAGDRTIDWVVSDGTASSTIVTSTVDVDVLPVIGGTGNTVQFYQVGGAVAVDSGLTLSAGANIASATATISSGFQSGDTLSFNNGTDTETFGDGSIIAATQTGDALTLTTTSGNATASDYQTALDSVTYSFSGDPTDAGTDKTRTVTWSVTDASSQTSAAGSTTTLDVYMTPELAGTVSPTPTVTSTSGAVTADSNLTVTDDNTIGAGPDATVIVGSAQAGDELLIPAGDLTGSTITGTTITVSGNDSTTLMLAGTSGTTAAQFQAALDAVQFDAVSPNSGTRSLTWQFNDDAGGNVNESAALSTNVGATFGPVLTAGAVSVSGAVEGVTPGTLSATFSDATTSDPASDFSGTIDWGDGTADTNFTSSAVSGSDGNFTVSGSHTYAEDGTYTTMVTIDDTGGTSTIDTGTTTVADAPLTPGAVSVTGAVEGTPGTLSATFSDANTGAPASDFSGTIDWGDGSADTNFTSAAVSGSDGNFTVSGSHTYAEDGTYTTTVTVDDVGGSTATESGTATVSQPFEVDNSPLSLSRGTTATIGPSLLRYGDIDTGPSGIAYTITGGPSDGTLLLNGSPTTSFTGAEVNNNELSYHETAGNVSSDSFTFTVANPFGATTPTQTFTIGISSGTPPFQLVDSPLSLTAGTTSAITLAVLRYGDPSVGPQQETYTVTTAPADGTLLLSGSPTTSFTQADINNGLVSYHETVANMVSDSFSFVVSDPFGNATAPLSFPIQINPTTPPFQFADSTLSLGEGTTSTIGSGLLRFGDFNCGPQQETYAITTAPADGTLLLNGTPTSSFTEADINNGLVSYHETASAPSDSFAFTVTDPYGNATPTHTFQIAISPDPPPFEINNNPLTIALGGTAGIGHALLAFGDTGSSPQQEMFTVTGAPTNGALLLNGSSTTSFSEADINNGLVSYHETAGGASSDSFAFTVSGPFGNTTPTQHFQINI